MLLDVDEVGADRAARTLFGIGDRAADARPALTKIADDFRDAERSLFATQGAGHWPPLKPKTIEGRRRRGQGTRVLVATGELMRSLTTAGAGSEVRVTKDELTFGTKVDHAKYQRKRPPVIIDQRHRHEAAETLLDHLMNGGGS